MSPGRRFKVNSEYQMCMRNVCILARRFDIDNTVVPTMLRNEWEPRNVWITRYSLTPDVSAIVSLRFTSSSRWGRPFPAYICCFSRSISLCRHPRPPFHSYPTRLFIISPCFNISYTKTKGSCPCFSPNHLASSSPLIHSTLTLVSVLSIFVLNRIF